MAESQWYLEVNGKKVGPFNLEHIQGLYDDGEIKGYHQVTSDQLDGQWISVQELVDSLTLSSPPGPPTDEPSLSSVAESDVTSQIEMPVLEEPEADSPPSFPDSVESEKSSEGSYVSAPEAPTPPRDFNAGFQPPPRPSADKTNSTLRSPALRAQTQAHSKAPAEPAVGSATAEPAQAAAEASAPIQEESSYTSPDSPTSLPPIVATLAQTPPNNDPALSMLSSLQLFKERQGNREATTYDPTLVIHSDNIGPGSAIPLRMWLTAIFAGLILGCLSWGVIKVLKSKPSSPAGTMVQTNALPKTPIAPAAQSAQSSFGTGNSSFKSAEPPKETMRRAPPRPLVAPVSAPAPVRTQEEQRRDEQPQEQPPQPQYAPQYQQYPQTGDQIQNGGAPVAPQPAQNVNGQNIYPSEQMPPAYGGGAVPGTDQMAPPQQQPPPGTMGGYPANPNIQVPEQNYNNGQNNNPYNGQDPSQQQQNQPNGYNNNGADQQPNQQPPPPSQ